MKTASLSKDSQEQLLQNFCEALANLRTPQEVLPFLVDLLTKIELLTLTKRLQIATLLLEGKDYRTIEQTLRVSHGTIARVAVWLADAGEGFRMAADRANKQKQTSGLSSEPSEWNKLKRRYPAMFWPQLLVEQIVQHASTRERERIQKAIGKLDHKSKMYRQFNEVLRIPFKKKRTKFNAT